MPGPYIQSWKKVSTIAKHIQTQSEWEQTMARRVMEQLRGELYLDQRYLTAALGALPAAPRESGGSFATDGGALYYPTAWLLDTYLRNRRYLPRAYLHSLFHCIFRHLWLRDRRDPDLWGLACDIAVEATLDTLNTPATKRPVGWVRQQCYTQLREKCKFLAAGPIYRVLAQTDAETLNKWQREFYTDSHRLWPADPDSPAAQMRGKQWENLGRQTELSMEESGRRAGQDTAAQALQAQVQAGRSRRTYRDFLRRFAVWHEEPHLDPEEFDLGFYSYGLRTYGNLPLIEPLESREVKKIRDFVIVVDTSESTAGELVKAFLKETFTLLKSQDSFFRQCRILVMQADNAVRDEVWLNDLDALAREKQLDEAGKLPQKKVRPAQPEVQPVQRRQSAARAAVRPSPVLLLGTVLVVGMVIALMLCYVKLTGISDNVSSIKREISALEEEHVALLTAYERTFDLATVKAAAEAAGMSKPSSGQIQYIDLSGADSVEVYAAGGAAALNGFTEKAESLWAYVLEYFR